MQAGKLRDKVLFQSATIGRDAIGGVSKSWSTYGSGWGQLKAVAGGERKEAGTTKGQVTHQWEFRFRTDVHPRHRILFGDRVFEIDKVYDPDSMRIKILADCIEEV